MKNKRNWIKTGELTELTEMLKALGHPSRISIMYMLCNTQDKKMTVKAIYEELRMSQPVISRHLGIMKNSGLIRRTNMGHQTYYEINEDINIAQKIAACFSSIDKIS